MIGKTISHYHITGQIGAGGMGIVYRAQDKKLRREVAIKVLHSEQAGDTRLLERLRKEARTLAELSHPNIGSIFGFEEDKTGVALVLELVEGKTLADLIQNGPLKINECLEIGSQIAMALDYAHARGVIHRDLKPANIKVGPGRRVRVLDFGLATHKKPLRVDDQAQTVDVDLTLPGMMIGSPAYMSPEQINGEPADERSDNWSFGCILFEMLTGQRVFQARTISGTQAEILTREPAWDLLPANCPEPLARLIKRCLQKKPERRLRSAGDGMLDLQELSDSNAPSRMLAVQPGRRRPLRLVWGLSLALVVMIGAVIGTRAVFPPQDKKEPKLTFDVLLPFGIKLDEGTGASLSLSPNADRIAYVGDQDGNRHVFLRRFDSASHAALPGTDNANCVAFSPDGQWLSFATPTKLKKIHLATQRVEQLSQLPNVGSICWADNDSIYFVVSSGFQTGLSETRVNTDDGIYSIHSGGGRPVRLTMAVANDSLVYHASLTVSPNGRHLIYTQNSNWAFSQTKVIIRDNQTGKQKMLIQDGGQPVLLDESRLLFMRNDELFHVFVDLQRGELLSDPVAIQSGVDGAILNPVSVAADGSLAFVTSLSGRYQIWDRRDYLALVNRDGTFSQLQCEPGGYALPSFTPDGSKATFTLFRERGADIWSFDLKRKVKSLLTKGGSNHVTVWTPSGKDFIYSGDRLGEATQPDIFIEPVDGTEAPRVLLRTTTHLDPVACTPDGQTLVYWDVLPDTKEDLFLLNLEGPANPRPYIQTDANESQLSFSPDGKYIAYTSDESGVNQVYIKLFAKTGGRIQVSADSGCEPLWHPSGAELFFLSSRTNQMYTVAIDRSAGGISVGVPQRLWELPLRRHGAGVPNWALDPDGEHFLVVMAEDAEQTKKHIQVALRWRDDLERRLAPAR